MRADGSETSTNYLLLGYVDAELLALYQAGIVPTLELTRTQAALTAKGQGEGTAVALYLQQGAAPERMGRPDPSEAAQAAEGGEPPPVPSLETLAHHLAEDHAEAREWPSLGGAEPQLDLPDDGEDYSAQERLEAIHLALAALEAEEEISVPLLKQVPAKSAP